MTFENQVQCPFPWRSTQYLYSSKDLDYLHSRRVNAVSIFHTQVQGLWRRKQPVPQRAEGKRVSLCKSHFNESNMVKGLFREDVVFLCGSVDSDLSDRRHSRFLKVREGGKRKSIKGVFRAVWR